MTADSGSRAKAQSTLISCPDAERPIGIQEPSTCVTRWACASTARPGTEGRCDAPSSPRTAPRATRNDSSTAPHAMIPTALRGRTRGPSRPLMAKPDAGKSGIVQSIPRNATPAPSALHDVDLVHIDGVAVAEQGQDDGQAHGHLAGRHGDGE